MRKPNLVLHIGTEKTGTTAIQEALAINRATLAEHSIYVPDIFGRFNHRSAAYVFQAANKQDRFDKNMGLCNDKEEKLKFKRVTKQKWISQLRDTDYKKWIISSEHFQSRLTSGSEVANLWTFLRHYYDDINVVIYLRDPAYTAYASFSTRIKNGATPSSLLIDPARYENNCNHKKIIQRWLSVVPRHQLDVRLYDRAKLYGGDVVTDFFKGNDLKTSSLSRPAKANESLSLPALRLMLLLNKKIPTHLGLRVNPIRTNLNKFVASYFQHAPRYLPSVQCLQAFDKYYEPSIRYIREEFFPDSGQELWSRPKSVAERPVNGDIIYEDYEIELSELVASIWINKTSMLKKNEKLCHEIE
ncbi:MAG: hypothetical protein KFB97_11765 [Cyanobium sp. M30B3]|nr:MAG: hypothetical protein KFB97_11765 [Cyanobium sp. M30B3]